MLMTVSDEMKRHGWRESDVEAELREPPVLIRQDARLIACRAREMLAKHEHALQRRESALVTERGAVGDRHPADRAGRYGLQTTQNGLTPRS